MMSRFRDWVDGIVRAAPGLADIKPAIESELLALAVMEALSTHRLIPDDAVFIGGTALRLCFGSPRFSEDLDFHLPPGKPFAGLDANLLAGKVRELIDCDVQVSLSSSPTNSRLATISAILPERTPDQPRPRTRIDLGRKLQLDARPTVVQLKMAGGLALGLSDMGDPFARLVSSREEILADKHLALVGRSRRIKCRDLFDIAWLSHGGTAFRPALLCAKLDDHAKEAFVASLRKRADDAAEAIANGSYQAELERYLPARSTWFLQGDMGEALKTTILDNANATAHHIETEQSSSYRHHRHHGRPKT